MRDRLNILKLIQLNTVDHMWHILLQTTMYDEYFVIERDISFEEDSDNLFSDLFDIVVLEGARDFVSFYSS